MKVFRVIGLLIVVVLFLTSVVTYAQSPAKESYDKGFKYATQGKFKEAKEEFEKALAVDKFFTPAEQSLKIIEDVIAQKIKRETAIHLFKGTSYNSKGQHDQAIKDYTKAIDLNPRYAGAYYNRGFTYYNKGQYDQAIKDYTKAIDLNPRYAEAYINRGVTYRDKGQHYQAIKDYTKALDLIYNVEKVINLDNALTTINELYSNGEIVEYTRELKDGVIVHYQTLDSLMDDPEGKRGYFYTCYNKDGGFFYCGGSQK